METKVLEIRDKGTFAPTIAIKMQSENEKEEYLLNRAGYTPKNSLVLFLPLTRKSAEYSPFNWNDRTFQTAHKFVQDHWSDLDPGDVVDVEYILEETLQPKQSERLTQY